MITAGAVLLTDKTGVPFRIRPFSDADRGRLLDMYDRFEPKRCAQGLPPQDEGARVRWLDSVLAGGHHLTVELDEGVMGHGMLIRLDDRTAELANFLHQSVRDRGIGTALNRSLVELAREHGIRRLWLSVEPSNRPAIRSYEKVGFRRKPGSLWAPEIEMEMDLT